MEILLIGLGGVAIYNFTTRGSSSPDPKQGDDIKDEISLPPPRVAWSKPSLWSSCPVEISDRPSEQYEGPLKDPRSAYVLAGGAKVPHSGKNQRIARHDTQWIPCNQRPSGSAPNPGQFKILHITEK